jgi:hypothetical protein
MTLAPLVLIVRIDLDSLFAQVMIVGAEDRAGRTDVVHEPRGEKRRGRRTRGEVDTVEVRERRKDSLDLVPMDLTEPTISW